jgi:hypothetical protein
MELRTALEPKSRCGAFMETSPEFYSQFQALGDERDPEGERLLLGLRRFLDLQPVLIGEK